jgi:hypothetical protein
MRSAFTAGIGLVWLAACGGHFPTGEPPSATPTFHKDVQPIVQRSCGNCHVQGGIAPFALQTFQDALPYAAMMASATSLRIMPPWDAVGTSDCQPALAWKDDARLSDADIATLQDWADAGAPEGNPADAPPPAPPPVSGLPGLQMSLTPAVPYTPSGSQDEFRCFVLDPKLTQDTWVNGAFVVAGNSAVVHHAVLFTDPTRASAGLADANGGYDCYGGVSLPNSQVLTVWTPGGVPFELPDNIGTPVAANSLLVMQIHYHPHSQTFGPDSTTVQLRFNPAQPAYYLATFGIGNYATQQSDGDGLQPGPDDRTSTPEFRIPANVAGHTETMLFTVPTGLPPLMLYGAMAHMHLIGTDLEMTVDRAATASNECMLHEPKWNFDWQRMYIYDAPIAQLPVLNAGDRIRVRCTYDNTTNNAFVERLLADTHSPAPFDVYLGEQTTDEMCLAILPILYVAP